MYLYARIIFGLALVCAVMARGEGQGDYYGGRYTDAYARQLMRQGVKPIEQVHREMRALNGGANHSYPATPRTPETPADSDRAPAPEYPDPIAEIERTTGGLSIERALRAFGSVALTTTFACRRYDTGTTRTFPAELTITRYDEGNELVRIVSRGEAVEWLSGDGCEFVVRNVGASTPRPYPHLSVWAGINETEKQIVLVVKHGLQFPHQVEVCTSQNTQGTYGTPQ